MATRRARTEPRRLFTPVSYSLPPCASPCQRVLVKVPSVNIVSIICVHRVNTICIWNVVNSKIGFSIAFWKNTNYDFGAVLYLSFSGHYLPVFFAQVYGALLCVDPNLQVKQTCSMLWPLTWWGHKRERAKAFFNECMSEQNTATKRGSADNLTQEAKELDSKKSSKVLSVWILKTLKELNMK